MFLEVREHSVSLNGGIDALNGITRQLASDSQQQADASSATAATIEQITVSINHIAGNATSAEEVVVQTGNLAPVGAGGGRAGRWHRAHRRPGWPAGHHPRRLGRSAQMDQIINVIRHRRPDQPLGAECGDRGGARRQTGAASQWWPTRCASWPSAPPRPRWRSAS
jgi:methyl-accepting chemotaxis protein